MLRRALLGAALLIAPAGGKRSKRPQPPQAAPIPLPDDAPIEDRLKAAILTHDNDAVPSPDNIYGTFVCRIYMQISICAFYIYIGRSR